VGAPILAICGKGRVTVTCGNQRLRPPKIKLSQSDVSTRPLRKNRKERGTHARAKGRSPYFGLKSNAAVASI
jgi:hypothetical protein